MACDHQKPDVYVWQEVEVGLYGETEDQLVNIGGGSACEDIDTHRYRCTKCGQVFYYSGAARDYYEGRGDTKGLFDSHASPAQKGGE